MKAVLNLAVAAHLAAAAHGIASEPQSIDISALERRALDGDAAAQFELGRAYFRGQGVAKNVPKAEDLLSRSAQAGNADAMVGLGFLSLSGEAGPEDETKAVQWFRKGAATGSLKAKFNLGLMLRQGKTIELSNEESLQLLHEAAAGGLLEARSYLGQLYFTGDRFAERNREMSYRFAREAADAGDPACQNIVGIFLRDGSAEAKVARDRDQATEWFRRSALQGHAKGRYNLAHIMGVESPASTNRVEALGWLLLAHDQGEPMATKTFQEIAPTLPKDLINQARQQAGQ